VLAVEGAVLLLVLLLLLAYTRARRRSLASRGASFSRAETWSTRAVAVLAVVVFLVIQAL
jgi:hypothetical protein